MNLYEQMIAGYEDSIAIYDKHRQECVDVRWNCDSRMSSVENILMPWAMNKRKLWEMFGRQLILKRKVNYARPIDELRDQMDMLTEQSRDFISKFLSKLQSAMDLSDEDRDYFWNSIKGTAFRSVRNWFNAGNLAEGTLWEFCEIQLSDGTKFSFSHGQKVMRAIGKLARHLHIDSEFEKFRVAHSLILNNAKTTGELCLSIHPLDFATASDNNNNWNSCMSWINQGCYRLGTVEMMTSPHVICAYLASETNPLAIGDGEWNSKKWRAWVIVDNRTIVVNRHYPCDNDEIGRMLVEWVAELAGPYYNVTYNEPSNTWHTGERLRILTNYMYNDMGSNHWGCYSDDCPSDLHSFNISGPAICQWCGDEITAEGEDIANTLACPECGERIYCHECGTYVHEDDACYSNDGQVYCSDCWSEIFATCTHCDITYYHKDILSIALPQTKRDHAPFWHFSGYYTYLCKECLENLGCTYTKINPLINPDDWNNVSGDDYYLIPGPDTTWDEVRRAFGISARDSEATDLWYKYVECLKKGE